MINKLNEQIVVEFESSNLYLQMAAWCAVKGFEGSGRLPQNACRGRAHAHDETVHLPLRDRQRWPWCPRHAKPQQEFESLAGMFKLILNHERFVTSKINELVALSYEEKDYSTLNFLQWYVGEQHEEENAFLVLVDKINLIAYDGADCT
jgi:ferritin